MEEKEKCANNDIENIIYNDLVDSDINEFLDVALKLWIKRKLIIRILIIFIIAGIFVAIFSPNEYTASSTMVTQTGEKKTSNGISGLAAMAGVNLSNLSSGEVLSPSVYPQILKNINFQKELLYTEYTIRQETKRITYYDYVINKKYRKSNLLNSLKKIIMFIPDKIIRKNESKFNGEKIGFNDSSDITSLTLSESKAIKKLFENLSLNINEREGYITLSFISYEPILSAEVVLTSQKLIQKYITKFKIEKVRSNLDFVEKNYEESKNNFEEKQAELAKFRDANKNLSSAIAKTHEEKLISEYNLLFNLYSEIAKQKEQAKIAVTETTPIMTIINPVVVPNEKSGPSRLIILISFMFLGLAAGIGWILGQPYIQKIANKIKN